jgi:hypothetical protein
MNAGTIDAPILAALREVQDNGGILPIKTILASLLWLSARHRETPGPDTLGAMEKQFQRLAVHPQATREDLALGLRLASGVCVDALLWLSACAQGGSEARH